MTAVRAALILSLLCVSMVAGDALAAERKSPRMQVATLPEPPRQRDPWTPPAAKLPETVVSATRLLFEQGLADPRDCKYRTIKVAVGSCWSGDAGVVTVHGWVLPAPR